MIDHKSEREKGLDRNFQRRFKVYVSTVESMDNMQ